MTNIVRRAFHVILKRIGGGKARKYVWDQEYSNGNWDFLETDEKTASGDIIYTFLNKYSKNGDILDLGCGSGDTALHLHTDIYKRYTGVDVSEIAVQKAIQRCSIRDIQKHSICEFITSDILSYVPTMEYGVILFRESLNYINRSKIKGTLDRYANYLQKNGVFIVRMYDRCKEDSIIKLIEKNYTIVEEYLADNNTTTIILVFSPLDIREKGL
ncbi:trans-aconitate methyltransferase [Candidatus Scalindua japonica]|uniref:Trans-aconitate methyltransferase n=1 Tax=Candidatus Scalindua japonica TaxID=1284222 RepID=A0A286TZB1_9BACT|nr:class I SAM-dependent methyltransferase [Candidatus Scalindua japonica]GAX61217.1 trans-aconitate methyltransferase [Candidatus Scalindua japonica]